MNAAFAVLEISDIPFNGPVGAVRIGRIDGEFIVNPTIEEAEKGSLNLTIAGTRNAIIMVEGGAEEESEAVLLEAFDLAQNVLREMISAIEELRDRCGKPKTEFQPPEKDHAIINRVNELAAQRLAEANVNTDKHERQEALNHVYEETQEQILNEIETDHKAAVERGDFAGQNVVEIANTFQGTLSKSERRYQRRVA